MKVLLSINPQHAEKIFSGEKRFEYRRRIYKNSSVRTIAVYVTRPVSMIVGEFDVSNIVSGLPDDVWGRTRLYSGITREFYFDYFGGRDMAFAISIDSARLFDRPINPVDIIEDFTPPQSYMYVRDDLGRIDPKHDQHDFFAAAE